MYKYSRMSRKYAFRMADLLRRDWRPHNGRIPASLLETNSEFTRMKKSETVNEVPIVYIGPTLEGPDAEYVKVISGKVVKRKPFFVMGDKMTVYCETCRDYIDYDVKNVNLTKSLNTTTIFYKGQEGCCKRCGNVVHVSELRDKNLYELERRIKEINSEGH